MEGIHADIKPYEGPFSSHKMSKTLLAAYYAHRNQVLRCYDQNNKSYKYYGAKGIRVRYSKRDFIGWYLHHIKNFKGVNPSVGRIDHDKDYCFANIKIESMRDNLSERGRRNVVNGRKPDPVYLIGSTGLPIIRFASPVSAAKLLGVRADAVRCSAYGLVKNPKSGFTFKFVAEIDAGANIKIPDCFSERYKGSAAHGVSSKPRPSILR